MKKPKVVSISANIAIISFNLLYFLAYYVDMSTIYVHHNALCGYPAIYQLFPHRLFL